MLENELAWANNQKDKLTEKLESVHELRTSSQGVTNMMSSTMVVLAVVEWLPFPKGSPTST